MAEVIKEVVGTSFAVAATTGDGQQITFQSGFADDEDDETVNTRIDRLMRIVARQRALGEAPALHKERAKLAGQKDQTIQDEMAVDSAYQTNMASLDTQIGGLLKLQQDTFDEGYAEHTKSGRQGRYTPNGARKQQLAACVSDIAKMEAEKTRAANEREESIKRRAVFHQQLDAAIAEIDEALAKAAEYGAT